MSRRAAIAAAGLASGAWLASAAFPAAIATALAASPAPSLAPGGDPRSVGQGPGLVGDPAFAILAVAVIGVAAVLLTLAYLRLTAPPRT